MPSEAFRGVPGLQGISQRPRRGDRAATPSGIYFCAKIFAQISLPWVIRVSHNNGFPKSPGEAGECSRPLDPKSTQSLPRANLRPVILCPAQFGTSDDYHKLKADLKDRGFDLYPAPLRRLDWVRPVPCPNIYCVALQCGGAHALFMGTCKQRQCSKSALL